MASYITISILKTSVIPVFELLTSKMFKIVFVIVKETAGN